MDYVLKKSDVLVIGGGIAGLRAAYQAVTAGCTVSVVSKGPRCSDVISGFNAPVGANDSVELFVNDISTSGAGINDPALAPILAEGSLKEVKFLENELNFEFKKEADGSYNLLQPLWCTVPRLVNQGTLTGAIEEKLLLAALAEKGVEVEAPVTIVELLKDNGAVCGALGYKTCESAMTVYAAKAVVMAAGGCGGLYQIATYSPAICGDSASLAYRAGAEVTNMEFIDHEPCSLVTPQHMRGMCLSSTMLFVGGKVTNNKGEDVIAKYFNDMSEVCKSRLSKAIYQEVKDGNGSPNGGVYFDVTSLSRDELIEHEGYIPILEKNGIDLKTMVVEIAPATHTCLGGIKTDTKCQSTLPGLFAAGEAMGNVHGANRIGGNAGTETLVFGGIAGQSAADLAKTKELNEQDVCAAAEAVIEKYLAEMKDTGISAKECAAEIRRAVTAGVPLLRNEVDMKAVKGNLEACLNSVGFAEKTAADLAAYLGLLGMTQTGSIIAESSLLRKESRGVFSRSDYLDTDDALTATNTVISLEEGQMVSRLVKQ